jgi:uncharacterized membrane protein
MMQNSLAGKLTQPMKGIVNVVAVAIIGTVLARGYGMLAPTVP